MYQPYDPSVDLSLTRKKLLEMREKSRRIKRGKAEQKELPPGGEGKEQGAMEEMEQRKGRRNKKRRRKGRRGDGRNKGGRKGGGGVKGGRVKAGKKEKGRGGGWKRGRR